MGELCVFWVFGLVGFVLLGVVEDEVLDWVMLDGVVVFGGFVECDGERDFDFFRDFEEFV